MFVFDVVSALGVVFFSFGFFMGSAKMFVFYVSVRDWACFL